MAAPQPPSLDRGVERLGFLFKQSLPASPSESSVAAVYNCAPRQRRQSKMRLTPDMLDPTIYVLEQLRKTVRALVIGRGDVKDRLQWAASELQQASPKEIHPDPAR